jgi:peptidoglycan-associated lipoprotein
MKQAILSLLLVFFVAACANKGQRGAEVDERSWAQVQAEREQFLRQEEAKRVREEEARRQREEEERRKAESPTIRPLAGESGAVQALGDSATHGGKLLGQRAIYYDYDRYDIREEYIPMIEAHAKFLARNPQFGVAVEGNCDSRGSREYNVALGQRRADNIKRALLALGVSKKQIQTTSFGAEKPLALGRDEDSFAKNRRSDLVYITAPRQ